MNAPEPNLNNLVQSFPPELLRPCATNPRQVIERLNEMADSIARVGILQPLLVRRHPTEDGVYEIVSGHRRFAGAQLAAEQLGKSIESLPCRLVDLTDEQVCEIQIVENLQREDLAPMDEANGYLRLVSEFKQTVDEIAERMGKSKAYVYAKLKLCALNDTARRALQAGQITESIGVLIARIPEPLQDKAVKALTEEDYRRDAKTESLSFRQAAKVLREQFTTDLRKAKWSLDDHTLAEGAPACNMCPKKSGNNPDEYPDITDPRVCMDPTCFAVKRVAHERQLEAIALEKADVKLKAGAARNAIDSWSGKIRPESGLVKLTDKPEGSTKTWNQLAKSAGIEVETIAVIDKERSKVHVVTRGDQLAKALKEAGVKVKAPKLEAASSSGPQSAVSKRHAEKAASITERNAAIVRTLISDEAWNSAGTAPWARILLDFVMDSISGNAAREGLKLLDPQTPEMGGGFSPDKQALRAAVLPQGDGDDCDRYIRAAATLFLATNVEVDEYDVAYRADTLQGPLTPEGIAKAFGITVDTPPEPTVAAPAKSKGKRAPKVKAAPAAEETTTGPDAAEGDTGGSEE